MTANGVLVVSGPPCSGKSSVGRALAASSSSGSASGSASGNLVRVEVDSLFEMLLPGSDRNRHDRMLAYDAAHAVAATLLRRGRTPVIECTYSRLEQRASLVEAIAAFPEASLWVVELHVEPDDAVRRWWSRSDPTDLEEELVRERAVGFPYSEQALALSSSDAPSDELARRISSWLEAAPSSVDRAGWAEGANDWD